MTVITASAYALAPTLLLGLLQAGAGFEAPSVRSASLGSLPYGARAAGLVVLAVDVDAHGAVSEVTTIKDLEPFGPVFRRSVSSWTFEPARKDGVAVAQPVLVVGAFRPAMLMFPAPPPPPPPPSEAPHSVPYPTAIGIPPYPPNRIGAAAVLVETQIDAEGAVTSARVIGKTSAFDDASKEAAKRWQFRPARHDGRAVASRAYLLFVYRQPS
jgi:TonB family protein